MIRLLRLLWPFRGWIALAVLLGTATVGSGVGLMATSAYLISLAALHPSIAALSVPIVGVRFFGIARGGFRYLERVVSHSVNFRLLARLRVWFYEALEPLAPARLTDRQSGDLLARAVADVDTLQDFYVRAVAPPAVAVATALGAALFLWQFHASLALALLAFLLVAGAGVPLWVRQASRRPGAERIALRARLQAELVDGLQGLADVTAFGQAEASAARVRGLGEALAHSQKRLTWINGLQAGLSAGLMNAGMWAVLALAVGLAAAGRLDGVFLAVVALATLAAFEAVLPLPLAAQSLEGALAAARRLFELADLPAAVRDPAAARRISPATAAGKAGLVVKDLRFAYAPGDPPALDGLSLDLPPGKRLAVVGASGAGKSTLVNLLLRFWDFTEGEIWLNGDSLRKYSQEDVRSLISLVPQKPYLFNATVRDNLRLARPQAAREEIVRAAQHAQLHDFIQSLPQQYETWIGERGLALSGGERQRLALARALLRDTPVLILDEPTANLDAATESSLLAAVHAAMAGRTVLTVTHRLVMLEEMDEIVVMRAGRIVERGTHPGLLAAGGLYRRMWDLQNRAQAEAGLLR